MKTSIMLFLHNSHSGQGCQQSRYRTESKDFGWSRSRIRNNRVGKFWKRQSRELDIGVGNLTFDSITLVARCLAKNMANTCAVYGNFLAKNFDKANFSSNNNFSSINVFCNS